MNQLPDEKIAALASAFADRLSLRRAAAACGVNRDTVLRYFRHFNNDESLPAALPLNENGKTEDHFVALARDILSPDIVSRIDARIRELTAQYEELKFARRVAERMHGQQPIQPTSTQRVGQLLSR
jgi:AcrR family transcriptional regulator